MDVLKAAVADSKSNLTKNKKKQKWKKDDSDSDEDEEPKKKYKRRGEIAHLRSHQDSDDDEAEDKPAVMDAVPAETVAEKEADEEEEDDDDADEVMRRLRGYSRPVTLFGESSRDRMARLKVLEMDIHEKHGGSMGTGHEIQAIIAQEVDNEIMQASLDAQNDGQQADTAETKKAQAKKERKLARRYNKYKEMKPKDSFSSVEEFIIFFFKRVLLLWEEELMARPAEEKGTAKGKVASATQKQTRQYIKPLFSELKRGQCPEDVVKNTEAIVSHCIVREYVRANESYLKMAIGNSAWPMGVTMVGIHERAGREKIFSQNVAHVLNNEKSRKYIQGMKRIMTFCQHAFPNVPSKMVI